MKLILCKSCYDVVKLDYRKRYCKCKKCWGKYKKDGLNAVVNSESICLGFNNTDLARAIRNIPEYGLGERFEAFVIPKICPTIKME